jgi:transcriptional pleiotropic regulator of transition state genes
MGYRKTNGGLFMKSTGVVRKVDELGRIVVPIEIRRTMDIAIKDTLEIYVEGDMIILKKYHPACIFCEDATNVISYKGKMICRNCLAELYTL